MTAKNIQGLRVLVVDDDEFFLDLTTSALRYFGIEEIKTATNGAEILLELARSSSCYDVILTDLNMPVMDGVELLRHLVRLNFSGAVILLTGEDQRILSAAESLAHAHQLNVLGILRKPIETDPLVNMLERWQSSDKATSHRTLPLFSVDELTKGLENREIVPFYQPRIRLKDESVVGVECLARWQHPAIGLIPPSAFIPIAEQHGLIGKLTQNMLEQSISQCSEWLRHDIRLKISINISAESLTDIRFPDQIAAIAKENQVPLSYLVLELTEDQLMQHLTLTLDTLVRMRLKGITLAIDDFGTGYSNLAQMKRAPFSELKIDRSLVLLGTQDADGRAILEASITLGKKLGLLVVTEGVETPEQLMMVRALGSDEVQGYYYAQPMAPAQFMNWMQHSPGERYGVPH